MDDTSRRVTESDEVIGRSAGDVRDVTAKATDADPDPETSRRASEIRHEIEQTRGEMSETIEAIQEKLRPRNIVAHASESLKTATTERVREMADTAGDTAHDMMVRTRDAAGGVVESVRNNPIPAALIGLGAAWLLMKSGSGASKRGNEYWSEASDTGWSREGVASRGANVSESAERIAARAKDYAGETSEALRRTGRRAQTQLQRMIEENPLLVGAGALMLGAAFGLAVPETERENEWMGEARDTVVERAQELARNAASRVTDAAESLTDAVPSKQE